MKISWYILFAFTFILLLYTTTTYINFKLSRSVTSDAEYFARSTDIIRNSGRFQRNVLIMVNGLRGYLLTGEGSFIESYNAASNENDSVLTELSSMITDSTQLSLLKEIKILNDRWTDEYTEPLKRAKMLSSVSVNRLDTFKTLYRDRFLAGDEKEIQSELQKKFKEFASAEYRTRAFRSRQLSASVRRTKRLSIVLTMLSIVTAITVVLILVSRVSRRINKMVALANTIAEGNYDVEISGKKNDELRPLENSLEHMAHELSKNISLLKRSNDELDHYAHVVSHDMKGPLRGISNVVNWIEEDHSSELSPKLREYLELIKGRITRAENLIEGLLAYARADKEELFKENVSVKAIIDEVIENLPNTRHIKIKVAEMPTLVTERLLLFQVFSNLVSNAIKYNNEAGEVRLYHREHSDHYEFFVQDTGVGIAQNHRDRIFVIFQTLNDRDSFESTGVGLSIVKKILDGKKQRISIRSELGRGSIFSFTWPKN